MAFESKDPWRVTLTDSGSNNYTYTSQAMEDALEKYKNDPEILSRIRAIVRSFNYTPGFLDPLLRLFHGDPLEKMKAEYALNADNALSEIINNAATRDYNSEAAQASRMEAAGMNADLLGVGDAASQQMTPPDETLPDPALAMQSAFGDVSGIAKGLFSIFPTIISLAQGFQSLKLGEEDIYQRRVSSLFGTTDSMIKDALRSIPDFDKGMSSKDVFEAYKADAQGRRFSFGNFEFDPDSSYDDYQRLYRSDGFSSWATSYLSDKVKSLPQRYRKRAFSDLARVVQSSQFDALRAAVQSGKVKDFYAAAEGMSSGVWNSDFGSFLSNFNTKFGSYQQEIFDLNKRLERDGLSIEMLENAYNKDYWSNLDGVSAAEAQNKQNAAIQAAQDYDKSENSFWNSLLADMPNNWFGQLLTLGILFLRANSRQGFSLPSVTSGSSYKRGNRSSEWNKSGGYSSGTDEGGSSWFSFRP